MGTRPVVLLADILECPCVQAANAGTMETMKMFSEI
jgi:hypothetical protein